MINHFSTNSTIHSEILLRIIKEITQDIIHRHGANCTTTGVYNFTYKAKATIVLYKTEIANVNYYHDTQKMMIIPEGFEYNIDDECLELYLPHPDSLQKAREYINNLVDLTTYEQ